MPNDNLLIATIRRIDLDCDGRLNYLEFIDSVRPQENFMRPKKVVREVLSSNLTNNKNSNF